MKLRDLVTPIITLGFFYDNVRKFIAGDQRGTHVFIKSNLSKYGTQNVLDVGCGTGEFAVDIEGVSYLGIDLNSNYIKNAEQKYTRENYASA
jgi:ubiquinone/menaquinone biosynthesis C-methylase UbiE